MKLAKLRYSNFYVFFKSFFSSQLLQGSPSCIVVFSFENCYYTCSVSLLLSVIFQKILRGSGKLDILLGCYGWSKVIRLDFLKYFVLLQIPALLFLISPYVGKNILKIPNFNLTDVLGQTLPPNFIKSLYEWYLSKLYSTGTGPYPDKKRICFLDSASSLWKYKRIVFYLLFGCSKANFGHYWGDILTHPILITTVFINSWPKSHWEPDNKAGTLSSVTYLVGIEWGTFRLLCNVLTH